MKVCLVISLMTECSISKRLELSKKEGDLEIPEIYYAVYQNIIAINHFNNEAYIFDHSYRFKK